MTAGTTVGRPTDSTVDPREVAFYRSLADTWWDRGGPFWPLHKLNELRVAYIAEALCTMFARDCDDAHPLKGLSVLDIGCGGGILAESMAKLGANVTGIDVVDKNIAVAALHANQQGLDIDYQTRTAESLAAAGLQFDVVLNMEVVEHVADLAAFMRSCNRLIRPGGVMFVATINRTWVAWLFAIFGAEYVLRWLPRGTHRYREFRKPAEIGRLCAADGVDVIASTGVAVNPLTRSFALTPRLAVNYMLLTQRRYPRTA